MATSRRCQAESLPIQSPYGNETGKSSNFNSPKELMLKPGGLMIVITPNLDSLAARLLASTWEWFIPPAHLFYFSPRSLSQLSNRLGLEVLQMTTRRGDGVSNCASIGAYLDYESLTLRDWQRESLQAALALVNHHTNSDTIIASLGLGNEVIGVLLRPSP